MSESGGLRLSNRMLIGGLASLIVLSVAGLALSRSSGMFRGDSDRGVDSGRSAPSTVDSGAVKAEERDDSPEKPAGNRLKRAVPIKPLKQLGLLVPAYFHPSGAGSQYWKDMYIAATKVPLVIVVNPNNGPGAKIDGSYAEVLDTAAEREIFTIGYVNTQHGNRESEEIEADLQMWTRLYPQIRGFFLDSQASEESFVEYYEKIAQFARAQIKDALIVTNPGTICHESYFVRETTDLACFFAQPEGFDRFALPVWSDKYARDKFAAFPYGVKKADDMLQAIRDAPRRGFGFLYVTDLPVEDPWKGLPSYWEDEVEAVRRINQFQAP